jgi:hypothetical protein
VGECENTVFLAYKFYISGGEKTMKKSIKKMFKKMHKVVAKKASGMMTAQEFKEYKCKFPHPDPQPITEYPVTVEEWAKEKKR